MADHLGFTIAEDAALKHRLSALSVTDDRDVERIPRVFFRYPEGETENEYPFITIDLVDISFDPRRQESERTYYYTNDVAVPAARKDNLLKYYPDELNESAMATLAGLNGFLTTDQFVPMDLTYQVTTHCRSQRHDRQLTMLILRRVFPLRRGFIEVPEDGTMRRCDLVDWRQADVLDQEAGYKKRIFRKVFTVTINAEIPQSDLLGAGTVLTVDGELQDYNPASPSTTTFSEDF